MKCGTMYNNLTVYHAVTNVCTYLCYRKENIAHAKLPTTANAYICPLNISCNDQFMMNEKIQIDIREVKVVFQCITTIWCSLRFRSILHDDITAHGRRLTWFFLFHIPEHTFTHTSFWRVMYDIQCLVH